MDELLGRARRSMLIYIYNVGSNDMLGLVRRSIDAGVEVRIMYDRTDTRQSEVAKLQALGVELRVAPSSAPRRAFTVCHQKYVVIDDEIVILGSANWATTSIPNPGTGRWKKGNREWLMALESGDAAALFTELFDLDWEWQPPPEELAAPALPAAVPLDVVVGVPLERPEDHEILPAADFELPASTRVEPLLSPQNYFTAVATAIAGASRSIWVEQQYVKAPDGSPHVARLLRLVADRVADVPGLDVRFIGSSIYPEGWLATRDSLAAYGLDHTLRALNPRHFTHCHNKGVIVDGETVVVSSTNWSDNSIGAAREVGLLLREPAVAAYYARAFDFDWRTGLPAEEVQAFLEAVPAVAVPADELHPPCRSGLNRRPIMPNAERATRAARRFFPDLRKAAEQAESAAAALEAESLPGGTRRRWLRRRAAAAAAGSLGSDPRQAPRLPAGRRPSHRGRQGGPLARRAARPGGHRAALRPSGSPGSGRGLRSAAAGVEREARRAASAAQGGHRAGRPHRGSAVTRATRGWAPGSSSPRTSS